MNMKTQALVAALALGALTFSVVSHATDVSKRPLKVDVMIKPNVIFGIDDSGSMSFEVMLPTNDGALWWDTSIDGAWDSQGRLVYNSAGEFNSRYQKFDYLFPNGIGPGERTFGDYDHSHFAIPPTKQFAWLRSAAYNPLYYNPAINYTPWAPAYVNGANRTFANANPRAAKSHPLIGTSTVDLTAVRMTTAPHTTFMMYTGMVVPKGAQTWNGSAWVTESADRVMNKDHVSAAIPYLPATYWVKENCTPSSPATRSDVNPDCALAPDGTRLKRYEIRSGRTFPSGRTYAAELQNFANWFQYYRKRTLMLSASMGQVLDNLSDLRMGIVRFNNRSAVTMYDADGNDSSSNSRRVAGLVYETPPDVSTPTRETLKYIGEQYRTNKNIIQYACQRNNAFIVTDGFADVTSVAPPDYNANTWGKGAPYQTTYGNTIADIALSYYTINLRSDLPAGRVAKTVRDFNTNLHMNSYGLTLGARGTLWPNAAQPAVSATPYNWPNPIYDRNPASVDDLWHATINSRGQMYLSTTPEETAYQIQAGLTDILAQIGAQSAVAMSSVNLSRGDGKAYLSSYSTQGWSGDLTAHAMDRATGVISETPVWSASTQLNAMDWTKRVIVSYNGTVGVPFTGANVGATVNPSSAYGDTAGLMSFLRGSRTGEGSTYRPRKGLLGAAINSEPVVVSEDGVIYLAANDGMVHAFDSTNGKELWAFVPGSVLPELGKTSERGYVFGTILDSTPVLAEVDSRKVLIGGRGTGGAGFYALDVTQPKGLTEAQRAGKVLWEFPSRGTPAAIKNSVGLSMGKPLVVKTQSYGTVVLLTSGYNSTLDGKGRVYMLNALTGELLYTFVTTAGTAGAGDAGLAQLSGFMENEGNVRHVYGGDDLGNLWHFDLEEKTVARVAALRDASNNPQSVTAAPELVKIAGQRVVVVGTGRLLGISDFSNTPNNSLYVIADTGTELTSPRSQLVHQLYNASSDKLTTSDVDWGTQRGWYMDLPAGQRANTDPTIAYGAVIFSANTAHLSDCTSAGYMYIIDVTTGGTVVEAGFTGKLIANTLMSKVTVALTTSGKVVASMHGGDNKVYQRSLPPLQTIPSRKNAWREVLR